MNLWVYKKLQQTIWRYSDLFDTEIKGVPLQFHTSAGVFSPNDIDKGTLAMLSAVDFTPEDKVLDLGCGYGVVGILAAKLIGAEKVTMLDIDGDAVVMARENARLNGVEGCKVIQSDGFQQLDEKDFTIILSNPPYHADFSVPKQFIEKGFNRLKVGGKMVMVTKRLDWYKNKLTAVFGGVRVSELDGYFVFTSIKKDRYYAKGKNNAKRGK
jgi:16S rRNA (guanine1207-N2)-methyltransferase